MRITNYRLQLVASVLLLSLYFLLPIRARAALITFSDENTFLIAAGSTTLESFESLADGAFSSAPIVAGALTLTPLDAGQIHVRSTPTGGHFPTDGVKYVEFGDPALAPGGRLQFSFAEPETSFGLSITDWGDQSSAGSLSIQTNAGEASSGVLIAVNPPQVASGGQLFFGLIQNTPFTSVTLISTTASDGMGIDEIHFKPLPEPSGALLMVGLLMAGGRFRRIR